MSLVLGLGREYARLLASRGAAVVGETDERAGGVVRVLIIGLLVVSYTEEFCSIMDKCVSKV